LAWREVVVGARNRSPALIAELLPEAAIDVSGGVIRTKMADRAFATLWQTLPACPDQQTSTDLPESSGSGEFQTW
jgi:hypothetical protein